jgi:NTP pyrophosphatase (non-canonical NTP hydrolase)
MKESEEIKQALLKFRNERDWEQFHNPKDLALAINIESAELLELFLWKNSEDANIDKVKEELADIFSFAFLLAEKYGFDVKDIILEIDSMIGKCDHDFPHGIASCHCDNRLMKLRENITSLWERT